jgi:hypothetical protein
MSQEETTGLPSVADPSVGLGEEKAPQQPLKLNPPHHSKYMRDIFYPGMEKFVKYDINVFLS